MQIVETEHLLKALLEQPNGLARRILAKAGANPSQLLEKVDQYIRRQPKVSGDANQVGHLLSACQGLEALAARPPRHIALHKWFYHKTKHGVVTRKQTKQELYLLAIGTSFGVY